MTRFEINRIPPSRVAVAEGEPGRPPALGRVLRLVIFDIAGGEARSPCYRVRHDQPGAVCDSHAELVALLHDCQVVIVGAAGSRLTQRLHACGIEVVATTEEHPAAVLVAHYLAGTLTRVRCMPTIPPPRHGDCFLYLTT